MGFWPRDVLKKLRADALATMTAGLHAGVRAVVAALAVMLTMPGAEAASPPKPVIVHGTLAPRVEVTVGSYLSGVVQEVLCDFNTVVAKGQVCARIDARRFLRAVEQARAAVATAKSQLELHKAELTYATAKLERNQPLFQRGVVSQDVYESILATHDKLQHQVEVDDATIAQRNAELELALVNLGYADIVAPIDGIVLVRNVSAGEVVQSTLQSPMLFIIAGDLHALHLIASVDEVEVGAVTPGDFASFTVKAYPDRTFRAHIVQVRQPANLRITETGKMPVRYDVVLEVENPDLLLRPGMGAEVRIGPGS
jgi:HlyD family secretion protein